MKSKIVIFTFLIAIGQAVKLPSFITPCSKSAPDFDDCCVKHATDALPNIIHGVKSIGIPDISPIKVPKIDIETHDLQLTLIDVLVDGLENIKFNQLKFDFDGNKGLLKCSNPKIVLSGNYVMKGKLVALPISGEGPFNMTIVDGDYEYNFDFLKDMINGVDHRKIGKDTFTGVYKRVYFKFEKLFNGDETLAKPINALLDDSWRDVSNVFDSPIFEFFRQFINSVCSSILKNVSEKEMFLD